jgi:hypothetical protein
VKRLVAIIVVLGALLSNVGAASADEVVIADPVGDVATAESETPASEPRVDITSVNVRHEARDLQVDVTVSQFVPLDDPLWQENLFLAVIIVGESDDEEDFFESFHLWYFVPDGDGGATGSLESIFSDDFTSCQTSASADEATKTYTLLAGRECLRTVPRSIRLGSFLQYDDDISDDDYDTPYDAAPDDDYSDPIRSSGEPVVTRLAGPNRIETAIALSEDLYEQGEAPAAVLASSDDFPDAIAGGPLAASAGGPLLLTGGDELDARVAAELERAVEPGAEVFLLGGTAVLGDEVIGDLREAGFRPKRLAGANRFETAVAVADEMGEHEISMVADGRSFQEALIAGGAAAALHGVVVLTDGDQLPPSTRDFLAHDPHRHVAIGTAASASAPGAEQITAGGFAELSQKVLDRLQPSVRTISVAGAGTFADALAGAPHLAALGGGLLLTDGTELSAPVRDELSQRAADLREVVLYGGTASLSEAVADAVRAAVSSEV